jgi:porphobilinogen synthase
MIETTAPAFKRTRRLRRTAQIRDYVRENELHPRDFVYPLFVTDGTNRKSAISSMPGQFQLSIDNLAAEIETLLGLGIRAVLLFGVPDDKDEIGSGAWDTEGAVQRATRLIKDRYPDILVITDVCACEYTSHGHCGILVDGYVDNDQTIPLLARTAVSHAAAGADIVAPSDMMDGRVAAIRQALDGARFHDTPIMSYAAKYASGYYGPFREAAGSTPAFGDRRSHQMDPGNGREAMREIAIDIEEGADLLIVKPALAYLDILRRACETFELPITAYNVSGEFAMIKAAAEKGWIDERRVTLETLLSMKRAGASRIITYHAKEAAAWLNEEEGRGHG